MGRRQGGYTPDPSPVVVFAPLPVLTVTVEDRSGADDIHVHAGGQGVWQSRMLSSLGVPVVLCSALGGETGDVRTTATSCVSGWPRRGVPSSEPGSRSDQCLLRYTSKRVSGQLVSVGVMVGVIDERE